MELAADGDGASGGEADGASGWSLIAEDVLCEANVSVVIFSSSGKLTEYCSPNTTLPRILEKYQTDSGHKLWDEKHERLSAEIDLIKKENDNMQIELRHLKGEDINSLQPKDLIPIEDALQNGYAKVREKQLRLQCHHYRSYAELLFVELYYTNKSSC